MEMRMNEPDFHVLNGKASFDGGDYAQPQLGTTEIWELENQGHHSHPIHLHLVDFEVIGRGEDGTHEPAPNERGPKDTVRVDPGETVRILTQFDGSPTPASPAVAARTVRTRVTVATDMDRNTLLETVSDRTDVDEESAADVTRAVLETLGERLSADEAEDLAAQLPEDLSRSLTRGESGQRFSEEEFVSRVDQRMDTVDVPGQDAATSVLGTVLEAVDESERAAVVDQFEHYGFEELLAEADADVVDADRTPGEY